MNHDESSKKAQPLRGAQRWGCVHPEAYCLMSYQDTDGNMEVVWNSRDQVTPFGMTSPQGNESTHVNWGADTFRPEHTPRIGDRIFAPMTPARAKETAAIWYDRFATHAEYGAYFKEQYPDREKTILEHALERLNDECPDVVVVTKEVLDKLEFQRPNVSAAL